MRTGIWTPWAYAVDCSIRTLPGRFIATARRDGSRFAVSICNRDAVQVVCYSRSRDVAFRGCLAALRSLLGKEEGR